MKLDKLRGSIKSILAHSLYESGLYKVLGRQSPIKILAYHRIIEPEVLDYPIEPPMFVRPDTFRMHCEILAKHFNVIPLSQLLLAIEEHKKGKSLALTPNSVVITFDDGWVDNYTNAFPILREFNLPACIFLATDFIATNKLLWADYYAMNEGKNFSPSQLLSELDQMKTQKKDKLQQIKQKALLRNDSINSEDLSKSQFLNWNQLREMQSCGIEFASHTHTHAFLDELESTQIEEELDKSLATMRREDIRYLDCLCYPNGFFSETSHRVLRTRNIRHVVMTTPKHDLLFNPSILGRLCLHQNISSSPSLLIYHLYFGRA